MNPDKTKTYRLGDLQHRIMKILWAHGAAAVGAVHEELGGNAAFAYTTIATMLRKMEARGLVKHREEGRSFIYSAKVREAAVSRSVTDQLVDRFFAGSLADAVSHLLSTREVSREELTRLEQLIAERKKSL